MSDPKISKNDIVNITVKISANQNAIYENAQFISMANPDGSGMWKFIADNKLVYAYPHIVEKP